AWRFSGRRSEALVAGPGLEPRRRQLRPGRARPLGRLAHGLGDRVVDALVERVGDELIVDCEVGDRPRGRELHLDVYLACARLERAAKDAGVAEHVVDAAA